MTEPSENTVNLERDPNDETCSCGLVRVPRGQERQIGLSTHKWGGCSVYSETSLSGTGEAECPTNCGWTAEEWVSSDPEATWKGTVRAPVHHRYKTPFCPDCGCLLKPEEEKE